MTKKNKIILSISSVLLVLIVYGWFFGFQTYLALFTRWHLREPGYSMVPQPMAVESRSEPASVVESFDYSFSVPWPELSELYSSTSMIWWATANSNIVITCFAAEEGIYSGMIGSVELDEDGHQAFMNALGLEGVTRTNYHLFSTMWNTTPQDISFFEPRSETAIHALFLMFKAIAAPSVTFSGVYCFETDHIKGVQVGDSAKDRRIHLSLFDGTDREIRITVDNRKYPLSAVTQADINTIITTFRVEP